MAQPYEDDGGGREGVVKSSWSEKDLAAHQEREGEERIRELQQQGVGGGEHANGDAVMRDAEEEGFNEVDEAALMDMDVALS